VSTKEVQTVEKRKPPAAGKGRPAGVKNKTTTALKEAILLAAEESGEDLKGKNGLVGYLTRIANDEPRAFAGLLGRVLPLQIAGDANAPITVQIVTLTTAEEQKSAWVPPI